MMRRGELIHLTWDDIRQTPDGDRDILIRPKEWTERGANGKLARKKWEPKDREIRAIPVHPVVEEILSELDAGRNGSTWVFTNTLGRRWTPGGLASLERLGLARCEKDVWRVLPLEEALRELDRRWDAAFGFGPAAGDFANGTLPTSAAKLDLPGPCWGRPGARRIRR